MHTFVIILEQGALVSCWRRVVCTMARSTFAVTVAHMFLKYDFHWIGIGSRVKMCQLIPKEAILREPFVTRHLFRAACLSCSCVFCFGVSSCHSSYLSPFAVSCLNSQKRIAAKI